MDQDNVQRPATAKWNEEPGDAATLRFSWECTLWISKWLSQGPPPLQLPLYHMDRVKQQTW